MPEKTKAVLTIRDASKMKPKEKLQICRWLESQAEGLRLEGHSYAARFVARFKGQ